MNFLIVGLGSMGKRRIRCLRKLGFKNIYGFDKNIHRVNYAVKEYNIYRIKEIIDTIENQVIDAIIISTSPDSHTKYIKISLEFNIPCFVEASVTDKEILKELSKIASQKKIFVAPSCTRIYYAAQKKIMNLVRNNDFGKLLYFNYSTGQYLPDWHPWENIQDYYVSKIDTGGCREIVPFELTWLNKLFGDPKVISCTRRRSGTIDAPIDDYYSFILEYPDKLIANITVEVLSRPKAHSDFRLTASNGQITYYQDKNIIEYNLVNQNSEIIKLDSGTKEIGYINPEEPYVEELNDFIMAVKMKNNNLFPNNLEFDYKVLNYLEEIEDISL